MKTYEKTHYKKKTNPISMKTYEKTHYKKKMQSV